MFDINVTFKLDPDFKDALNNLVNALIVSRASVGRAPETEPNGVIMFPNSGAPKTDATRKNEPVKAVPEPQKPVSKIKVEEIRARINELITVNSDNRQKVVELLSKFGVTNLSSLDIANYDALYQELEAM